MLKNKTGMLLTAFMMLCGTSLQAQFLDPGKIRQPEAKEVGVPELRWQANKAFESGDYKAFRESMKQLHKLRPNNSDYMYQLVLAHALLNEKSEAFNIMLQMQRQGLSYDFDQSDASENLRSTELYSYLNDLMARAGDPLGTAPVLATLAPEIIRPEAIDWDEEREVFLVGTVRDGTITAVSKSGASEELLRADNSNGIWGIYDLQVDRERNRLWVISASSEEFSGYDPVDKGRSALFEFDLGSLDLIKRYPVPVDGLPHRLRSMALAPNGDIYVSDGVYPIVYVKEADKTKLRPLLAFEDLVSLRGMDISDDGKRLYLADYEMGIVVANIANGKSTRLQVPETLNLGGIEGLEYWNGRLVIIQNGIKPQRIMRLGLAPSGRAVSKTAALAVALEIMDYPNYGTVVGDDLVFFANSHWSRSGESFEPVRIASTSLTDVPDMVAPDMDKFMSEYRQAQESGGVKKGDPDLLKPKKDEPAQDKPGQEEKQKP